MQAPGHTMLGTSGTGHTGQGLLETTIPVTGPFTPGSGFRQRHGITTSRSPSNGVPSASRNYDEPSPAMGSVSVTDNDVPSPATGSVNATDNDGLTLATNENRRCKSSRGGGHHGA